MSSPPDYAVTKAEALQILDDLSMAQVNAYYGKTPGYDAKSQLLRDLGIPADYFGVSAPEINRLLKAYPGSKRLTSKGLRNCNTIGDFISLFCKAAGSVIPAGEPK